MRQDWRSGFSKWWRVDANAGAIYGKNGCEIGYQWGTARYRSVAYGRNKKVFVHQVIWESVHGTIPDGLQINHKNGVRTDNRISNLELVTPSENSRHAVRMGLAKGRKGENHPMAKLHESEVLRIRELLGEGKPQSFIAKEMGVSPSTISLLSSNKRWTHV